MCSYLCFYVCFLCVCVFRCTSSPAGEDVLTVLFELFEVFSFGKMEITLLKKKKKKFKSAVSKNILARAKIAATLHEQPFELREWVDSTLWRWLLSKENLGGIKQRAITACQKAPREGRFAKSKCMQSLMPINYVMGGRALELLVCVVDHLWCILSLMSAWSSGALPLNYSHAATFTSEELHWMIAHFFSVSLFL